MNIMWLTRSDPKGEGKDLSDYGNYQRLYERKGKYEGGVPNFD